MASSTFLQSGKIGMNETAVMDEEVTLNERPLDERKKKRRPEKRNSETTNIVGDGPAENILGLSPVQIQQEYFENLLCDWVRYERSNRNHLLQNIAFALLGSPSLEGELSEVDVKHRAHLKGYNSRQKKRVLRVYKKLCEQRKYSQNDEDIIMSVLLIVCARPKPLKFCQSKPSNYWVGLHNRSDIDIWCTAVFRVRKCISTTNGVKSCQLYIDENARVYQNWDSYLRENTLPKCVMIVPENGEYQGTIIEGEERSTVKLTVHPSPTLGLKSRVLSSVDTANTVVSIGAIGVLGMAASTPVAPIVLAGAAVATVTTGIYGLVRSSLHLHDRAVHEQTISLSDAEARGSWLNIAALSVGLGARGASSLLHKSAKACRNLTKTGQALKVSVDVLRHANLVTGGAGVLNSLLHIVHKYRKHGEKPTNLELFQFTAATLFFCNAVMSNQTAQQIIDDAQANTINEHCSTLRRNRHRCAKKEESAECVQGIKNIADKNQYFADILRINKMLNGHGEEEENTILGNIRPGEVFCIGAFLSTMSTSGAKNIATLLQDLSQELYDNLMTVSINLLSKLVPRDIANLKLLSPDEDLIEQIVKFVFDYVKHNKPFGEPEDSDSNFVVLKEFFQEGLVRQETILLLKDRLLAWIDVELNRRRQQYPNKKQIICRLCQGVRFA